MNNQVLFIKKNNSIKKLDQKLNRKIESITKFDQEIILKNKISSQNLDFIPEVSSEIPNQIIVSDKSTKEQLINRLDSNKNLEQNLNIYQKESNDNLTKKFFNKKKSNSKINKEDEKLSNIIEMNFDVQTSIEVIMKNINQEEIKESDLVNKVIESNNNEFVNLKKTKDKFDSGIDFIHKEFNEKLQIQTNFEITKFDSLKKLNQDNFPIQEGIIIQETEINNSKIKDSSSNIGEIHKLINVKFIIDEIINKQIIKSDKQNENGIKNVSQKSFEDIVSNESIFKKGEKIDFYLKENKQKSIDQDMKILDNDKFINLNDSQLEKIIHSNQKGGKIEEINNNEIKIEYNDNNQFKKFKTEHQILDINKHFSSKKINSSDDIINIKNRSEIIINQNLKKNNQDTSKNIKKVEINNGLNAFIRIKNNNDDINMFFNKNNSENIKIKEENEIETNQKEDYLENELDKKESDKRSDYAIEEKTNNFKNNFLDEFINSKNSLSLDNKNLEDSNQVYNDSNKVFSNYSEELNEQKNIDSNIFKKIEKSNIGIQNEIQVGSDTIYAEKRDMSYSERNKNVLNCFNKKEEKKEIFDKNAEINNISKIHSYSQKDPIKLSEKKIIRNKNKSDEIQNSENKNNQIRLLQNDLQFISNSNIEANQKILKSNPSSKKITNEVNKTNNKETCENKDYSFSVVEFYREGNTIQSEKMPNNSMEKTNTLKSKDSEIKLENINPKENSKLKINDVYKPISAKIREQSKNIESNHRIPSRIEKIIILDEPVKKQYIQKNNKNNENKHETEGKVFLKKKKNN